MDTLLKEYPVRSKTEYINEAIALLNHKIKRQAEIGRLKKYFASLARDSRRVMDEFQKIRKFGD